MPNLRRQPQPSASSSHALARTRRWVVPEIGRAAGQHRQRRHDGAAVGRPPAPPRRGAGPRSRRAPAATRPRPRPALSTPTAPSSSWSVAGRRRAPRPRRGRRGGPAASRSACTPSRAARTQPLPELAAPACVARPRGSRSSISSATTHSACARRRRPGPGSAGRCTSGQPEPRPDGAGLRVRAPPPHLRDQPGPGQESRAGTTPLAPPRGRAVPRPSRSPRRRGRRPLHAERCGSSRPATRRRTTCPPPTSPPACCARRTARRTASGRARRRTSTWSPTAARRPAPAGPTPTPIDGLRGPGRPRRGDARRRSTGARLDGERVRPQAGRLLRRLDHRPGRRHRSRATRHPRLRTVGGERPPPYDPGPPTASVRSGVPQVPPWTTTRTTPAEMSLAASAGRHSFDLVSAHRGRQSRTACPGRRPCTNGGRRARRSRTRLTRCTSVPASRAAAEVRRASRRSGSRASPSPARSRPPAWPTGARRRTRPTRRRTRRGTRSRSVAAVAARERQESSRAYSSRRHRHEIRPRSAPARRRARGRYCSGAVGHGGACTRGRGHSRRRRPALRAAGRHQRARRVSRDPSGAGRRRRRRCLHESPNYASYVARRASTTSAASGTLQQVDSCPEDRVCPEYRHRRGETTRSSHHAAPPRSAGPGPSGRPASAGP